MLDRGRARLRVGGGSISVRRLVRLAQGRLFKFVEPRIPLPEKCQYARTPGDRLMMYSFSFNIPVPGTLTNICQVVAWHCFA